MGFLSFFGGLFWLVRRVFSGFWGLLCFSFVLLLLAWGGGRVAGGSGARGWRARVSCFLLVGGRVGGLLPFRGGWAWGCACVRPVPELSGSGCGRVRWSGSGCACCPVPVVGVGLCPVSCSCSRCCCRVRGGFSGVVFFRPVLLVFFWFPVLVFVVLPGVGGLWGVSGWVRGCFFSGFCCTGPGLFGFGLGFVWRV